MCTSYIRQILDIFESLTVDESWTFEGFLRKDITYLTNSYHRYPARFIPQLVNRLLREYSEEDQTVCDPFAGGGTALIESLVLQRRTIGVDINPVSHMIMKTKTTTIESDRLEKSMKEVFARLDCGKSSRSTSEMIENSLNYERIEFWFPRGNILELLHILSEIEEVDDEDIRRFLECGFSHILKKCSRWGMRSIKPYVEKNKQIPSAIATFKRHIRHMAKKNTEFCHALPKKVRENIAEYTHVFLADCRKMPIEDKQVSLIATSPPYVTSYEYADVHQLTMMWLYPETCLPEFRKKFIGTSQMKEAPFEDIRSQIAHDIVDQLKQDSQNRHARAVLSYFADLQQAMEEFYRVLRPRGKTAIVIGNTRICGVDILNAEVFTEIALNSGFRVAKVVKRRLPDGAKFLPTSRDPDTGCFASSNAKHKKLVYPHEYIVILSKQ